MPEEAKTAEEKDWTIGFSDEIKKDPEGWAAWLKSIRSSAKSRDALQEDQLHHVMEMVTRNWKWTAPTKISKAQIVDRLGNLSSWRVTDAWSGTINVEHSFGRRLDSD